MAQLKTIDTTSLANLTKVLVGIDRILNSRYTVSSNYPPHNIVKHNETEYTIEVAIAGFSKDEISIEVDHNAITVRGERGVTESDVEYLYKGVAARDFVVQFPLTEYLEVRGAEIKDGMLIISVEYVVPETLKPRRIEIQ